jgi:hypothetical protein
MGPATPLGRYHSAAIGYAVKRGLLTPGESADLDDLLGAVRKHAKADPEAPGARDLLEALEAYLSSDRPTSPLPVRVRLAAEPDLSLFRPSDRDKARAAIEAGDVSRLMMLETNELSLQIAAANAGLLRERGLLERAFVHAWTITRTNWAHVPLRELRRLLALCDRERLRAEGDPLPDGETFTLYRGVAGRGHRRRESGLSWTRSREKAAWFGRRFFLEQPAVLCAEVSRGEVLFYDNGREEDDFVLFSKRWRTAEVLEVREDGPGETDGT